MLNAIIICFSQTQVWGSIIYLLIRSPQDFWRRIKYRFFETNAEAKAVKLLAKMTHLLSKQGANLQFKESLMLLGPIYP